MQRAYHHVTAASPTPLARLSGLPGRVCGGVRAAAMASRLVVADGTTAIAGDAYSSRKDLTDVVWLAAGNAAHPAPGPAIGNRAFYGCSGT